MKLCAQTLSMLAMTLAVSTATAQLPVMPERLQSLRVAESSLPVFPYDMIQLGVREGEARIAFSVDTKGNIEDCLAVAYSHPEFARVSIAALKHWKFEPARFQGQPIAAASEVMVKFQVEGTVVVSLTPSESISAFMHSIVDRPDYYRPRTLKELDRIPTPIAAPSPAFPERLAKSGSSGQVTVSFYIDENGAVRLPSVDANDDPDLGAAAIEALRNWKFEPPTWKNRPVLVRASQQFNFRADTKAAKSS